MADQNILTLKTGGEEHRGWTSVTVTRGMELAASSFSLALARTTDGETLNPIGVRAGESCEVWIGDDKVLTGWVDGVEAQATGDDYQLAADGRSLTSDLIDCSAAPAQFKKRTLAQIAGALAVDYDVSVVDEVSLTETYRRWRPEPGEPVFAGLDRLAKGAQVLLTDDADGALVITRAGTDRGQDITADTPVTRQRCRVDVSQRFTIYEVRGQAAGDDQNYSAAVAHGYGETSDEYDMTRVRRLEVRAESGQGYAAACKARAVNEAVTRAGRSVVVELTVPGWRMSDGRLWWTNRLHLVRLPLIRVDGDLLLSELTFSADGGGRFTRMVLVPPGMFEFIEPTKRPSRGKKKITKAAEQWFTSEEEAAIAAEAAAL